METMESLKRKMEEIKREIAKNQFDAMKAHNNRQDSDQGRFISQIILLQGHLSILEKKILLLQLKNQTKLL